MYIVCTHVQAIQGGSSCNSNVLLRNLKEHLHKTFAKDFPLYLALALRFSIMYPKVYSCDERETFIHLCIDKLEGMKPEDIAPVINNFVERYVLYVLLQLLWRVSHNNKSTVQTLGMCYQCIQFACQTTVISSHNLLLCWQVY